MSAARLHRQAAWQQQQQRQGCLALHVLALSYLWQHLKQQEQQGTMHLSQELAAITRSIHMHESPAEQGRATNHCMR